MPKLDIKYILLLAFIQIISIQIVNIQSIQIVISMLEWLIVIGLITIGKVKRSLYVFTLFGSIAFDQSAFVFIEKETPLYNIFQLPYVGMLPLISVTLYYLLYVFKQNAKTKWFIFYKNNFKVAYRLFLFVGISILVGIFAGIFSYIYEGVSADIFNSAIRYDLLRLVLPLSYIYVYGWIFQESKTAKKFIVMLFHLLLSCPYVMLYSILSNTVGYYGNEREMVPLVALYSVFSSTALCFITLKINTNTKFIVLLSGVLSIFIIALYSNPLGGKAWIIFAVSLCFIVVNRFKNMRIFSFGIIIVSLFVFFSIQTLSFSSGETLSSNKFSEFLSLVNVFDVNWYDQLSGSPKFRIDEFLNIMLEYMQNPKYLLFGKGLGGTVQDYTQTFGLFNEAAFSDDEYNKGLYYSLHESVNVVFLKFGFIGLTAFITILVSIFKKCFSENSVILLIGGGWLVFFISYSYALLFFGLPLLVGGLRVSRH